MFVWAFTYFNFFHIKLNVTMLLKLIKAIQEVGHMRVVYIIHQYFFTTQLHIPAITMIKFCSLKFYFDYH